MNRDSKLTPCGRAAAMGVLVLSGAALALAAGCSANSDSEPGPGPGPGSGGLTISSFSQQTPAVQGSTTSFTWQTSVPADCSLSGTGPNGFQDQQPTASPPATSKTLPDAGVYNYTLSCVPTGSGSGATPITSTLSLNVPASNPGSGGPAINAFGANPNPATPGQQVTFAWTTTGASSCSLTDAQGTVVGTTSGTVVTAPGTAGTYDYTLTCQTSTGATTTSTYPLIVQANTNPSGPVITGFSANPQTVNIGDTTTLAWATNDATSCELAGTDPYGNAVSDPNLPQTFQGKDSPSGGFETAAFVAGVQGTAKNGTGVYTYKLTCTDANGTSTQSTHVFVVASGAPTVTITPLLAQPVAILQGAAANTSQLTWNHPEAVSGNSACQLSGTDPNGAALSGSAFGPQPQTSPSGGITTPAQTIVGTYTYELACTNAQTGKAENADTAQVVVVDQSQISQALAANFNEVTVGDTVNLTWNHPGADSCTATETDPNGAAVTGAGAFSGTQPVSMLSQPFTTGALNTVGNYKFNLICTNADGSTNAIDPTVTVTVSPANPVTGSCSPAQIAAGNAKPWLNTAGNSTTPYTPSAKSSGLLGGGLLAGLMGQVSNLANVVDGTATTPATITVPLGLLGGGEAVTVTDVTGTTYPAGRIAGVVIQVPNQGLGAGVLQNISISTLLNGNVVDTTNVTGAQGGAIKVKALPGLVNSSVTQPVAFATLSDPTSAPFNAIQVKVAGVANVLNQLSVYYACVAKP